MFFALLFIVKLSNCFEIDSFVVDIVKHFGHNDIELFGSENDFELSSLISDFWHEDVTVSCFDEKQNSTHNTVVVLDQYSESLMYVKYHYSKVWFMHVDNMKYIGHWGLRLDSLVYLWQELENKNIEFKARFKKL